MRTQVPVREPTEKASRSSEEYEWIRATAAHRTRQTSRQSLTPPWHKTDRCRGQRDDEGSSGGGQISKRMGSGGATARGAPLRRRSTLHGAHRHANDPAQPLEAPRHGAGRVARGLHPYQCLRALRQAQSRSRNSAAVHSSRTEGVVSMATQWGRKETIIWPPHVPMLSYTAIATALLCSSLFVWQRYTVSITPLQRSYMTEYARSQVGG